MVVCTYRVINNYRYMYIRVITLSSLGVLITHLDRIVMRRGDENIIIRWGFILRGIDRTCEICCGQRARSSSYGLALVKN